MLLWCKVVIVTITMFEFGTVQNRANIEITLGSLRERLVEDVCTHMQHETKLEQWHMFITDVTQDAGNIT